MHLYTVSNDYLEYLFRFDQRVPLEHEDQRARPYVGVVIERNGVKYFAPLSSPKPKHQQMPDNMPDCIKIVNGTKGVLNLNNMIPVNENQVNRIILPNTEEMVNLSYEEVEYINLLFDQLNFLNQEDVINRINHKASRLLRRVNRGSLAQRCCNWQLLEEKCLEYNIENRR